MPAVREPLFFIHIPKTAGTSFREAAIKQWGSKKVCSDYGESEHTSPAVSTLVHQQRDYFAFRQHLLEKRVRMLSAHAPVKFYRRIFDASQLVTFVRDPVARTISHYYTACSKQGFKGSFETFCQIPEHQNVQSRYLEQMPLEALGFVGLTERYSESVQTFNKSFAEKLRVLSLNQYAGPQADSAANLSDVELECAREINREDTALYHAARDIFNTRHRLQRKNLPFTHGKIQLLKPRRIEGWAFDSGSGQPVDIEILLNGHPVASKQACEYVAPMKERNIGRAGYVGFVHTLHESLTADDVVEARVATTGQMLRGPNRIAAAVDNKPPARQHLTDVKTRDHPQADQPPLLSVVTKFRNGKAANE